MKIFSSQEGTIQRSKKTTPKWEKIFAKLNCNNDKKTKQTNKKTSNNPILKWAEDLQTSLQRSYTIGLKPMKQCSTSLIIVCVHVHTLREIQIKTTVKYQFTHQKAIIKTNKNKYWQGCGKTGTLAHCW